MKRGPRSVAVLLALGVLVLMPTRPIRATAMTRAPAFQGTCAFTGTVQFRPAIGLTSHPGIGLAGAGGRCSGTLQVGTRRWTLSGAKSGYQARDMSRTMDCEGGRANGEGRLRIANHAVLRFDLTEVRIGAASVLRLTGLGGWSATGVAYAAPSANPIDELASCASGRLASTPIAIQIRG